MARPSTLFQLVLSTEDALLQQFCDSLEKSPVARKTMAYLMKMKAERSPLKAKKAVTHIYSIRPDAPEFQTHFGAYAKLCQRLKKRLIEFVNSAEGLSGDFLLTLAEEQFYQARLLHSQGRHEQALPLLLGAIKQMQEDNRLELWHQAMRLLFWVLRALKIRNLPVEIEPTQLKEISAQAWATDVYHVVDGICRQRISSAYPSWIRQLKDMLAELKNDPLFESQQEILQAAEARVQFGEAMVVYDGPKLRECLPKLIELGNKWKLFSNQPQDEMTYRFHLAQVKGDQKSAIRRGDQLIDYLYRKQDEYEGFAILYIASLMCLWQWEKAEKEYQRAHQYVQQHKIAAFEFYLKLIWTGMKLYKSRPDAETLEEVRIFLQEYEKQTQAGQPNERVTLYELNTLYFYYINDIEGIRLMHDRLASDSIDEILREPAVAFASIVLAAAVGQHDNLAELSSQLDSLLQEPVERMKHGVKVWWVRENTPF